MIDDVSPYDCPKCDRALREGPACTLGPYSWPMLGCNGCGAAYVHPDHPIPGLSVAVKKRD